MNDTTTVAIAIPKGLGPVLVSLLWAWAIAGLIGGAFIWWRMKRIEKRAEEIRKRGIEL